MVSLLYLLLPTVLFLATWVEIEVSVVSLMALVGGLTYAILQVLRPDFSKEPGFAVPNGRMIFISLMTSFLLCLISEFGVSPFKSFDHIAHNYKFHLLTTSSWPLFDSAHSINACYYFGFYMVPAVLGKLTGVAIVKYAAFSWIWLGLFLSMTWINLRLFPGRASVMTCLIVFLLVLAGGYTNVILPLAKYLTNDEYIYNNAVTLDGLFVLNQVPVFSRSLSESVQHALPSILGAALLLAVPKGRGGLAVVCLSLFGTLFWSPFTAIGMVPFVLLRLVKELKNSEFSFLVTIAGYGASLVLAFGPVLLFLLSSDSTDIASNRFIWQAGVRGWFVYYLLYLFSFFGVWILLLRNELFRLDGEMVWVAMSCFALLGLVQMGYFNDLNIRASLVPMVVLSASIAYAVWKGVRTMPIFRRSVLMILLFTSFLGTGKFYFERFFLLQKDRRLDSTIEHPHIPYFGYNFYDFLRKGYIRNGEEVVKQYSLKRGSIFEKYILRVNHATNPSN